MNTSSRLTPRVIHRLFGGARLGRKYVLGAIGCALSLLAASSAVGESVIEDCQSLGRANIDCACVGQRMDDYLGALPRGTDTDILIENYRFLLAKPNTFLETVERFMRDPMQAMSTEMALDKVGGRPTSINDFESGCVIEGAGKNQLPDLPDEPTIDYYLEKCNRSTGVPRFCECSAATQRAQVTKDQFEAYYRSFSDYSDDDARSLEEMAVMRAKNMNISVDEYKTLASNARKAIDESAEQGENLCTALLWPDDAGPEDYRSASSSDVAATSGLSVVDTNDKPASASGAINSAYPKAAALFKRGCIADDYGEDYCTCLLADVEQRVFTKLDKESVALAYALMQGGANLEPMEAMSLMSSLTSAQQMQAVMLGQVEVGESCEGR